MKYYKDTAGNVYAFSDIQKPRSGLIKMSSAEVDVHLNPKPTAEQLASYARYERDEALRVLDEVVSNPLRFSELLEEQRLEAATYRKLLLDVPQQKSFPASYTFPKTPEWL